MKLFLSLMITLSTIALSPPAPVQNFSLENQEGKTIDLSSFRGKIVILEWYNQDCPFVRKHYDSKNMQKTQKLATDRGHIWLSIVSSAQGKQGHLVSSDAAKGVMKHEGSFASHLLRDTTGKVGKSFNIKTTPQIVIIDKNGYLKYNGAIDSISSADKSDIGKAKNYVQIALDKIEVNNYNFPSSTRPYGCSVKY